MTQSASDIKKKQHAHPILVSISFLAIITCLSIAIIWFYLPYRKVDQNIQNGKNWDGLIKAISDLNNVWISPDLNSSEIINKTLTCLNISPESLQHIDKNYFNCNMDFFKCWIQAHKGRIPLSFDQQRKDISVSNVKLSSPLLDGYAYGINMQLSIEEKEFSTTTKIKVHFEDVCSNLFLPERIYSSGPMELAGTSNDWKFDTFNRAIYVDKFLVNKREILEWTRYDLEIKNRWPEFFKHTFHNKDEELAEPAVHLNKDQMERYCLFHGKQLMVSHLYDAAAFYPDDIQNPTSDSRLRAPYPWSKKIRDSFLFMAMHDPKFEFQQDFCKKVLVKDCIDKKLYLKLNRGHVSWMGMFQILGGPMEYLRNQVFSPENLRPSSYYMASNSAWHQLGRRAHWSGQGHTIDQFDFGKNIKTDIQEENLDVGFRCMKERVYKEGTNE